MRPDELFDQADLRPTDGGYEVHLPASDDAWALARVFVEEEAECCPFFDWDVYEDNGMIIVRAETGTARS